MIPQPAIACAYKARGQRWLIAVGASSRTLHTGEKQVDCPVKRCRRDAGQLRRICRLEEGAEGGTRLDAGNPFRHTRVGPHLPLASSSVLQQPLLCGVHLERVQQRGLAHVWGAKDHDSGDFTTLWPGHPLRQRPLDRSQNAAGKVCLLLGHVQHFARWRVQCLLRGLHACAVTPSAQSHAAANVCWRQVLVRTAS